MCRVGDVLDFYNVPSIQDRSKFDELVAGNLPPNLKISWGYWAGQQLTALRCCTLLTEVTDKPCEVLPFRTLLKPPFLYCFVFSCRRIHLFFSHESTKKTFSHLLKLSPQPPIKSSFDNLCNVLILMFIVSALERNRSDSMNTYLKGIYQISLHYDLVHQWLFHTGEAENPGLLSPQGWLYPPAWCWGPGGFFGELFTSKPCWQPEKAGLIWGKQCSDGRNRLGVLANRQKAKPSFCMGSNPHVWYTSFLRYLFMKIPQ